MLIYDILINDHRMIMNIIDAIEKISDYSRRKDLFSFLRTELVMHSKAEEEVLYRPLRELGDDDQLVSDSFEDHHEIEELLMAIQATPATSLAWIKKVRELRDLIEAHVEQEEEELFPLAQEQFSDAEAEDIAIRMMEEKGKLGMENPFAIIGRKMKDLVE